jgi:hypothetical protein
MLDKGIQDRIDQLYRDLKPLQDYYGIRSKTIEERYEEHKRKQAVNQAVKNVSTPRFKLPKL